MGPVWLRSNGAARRLSGPDDSTAHFSGDIAAAARPFAVAECGETGDPQFVRVEAMQAGDDSMEEVLARVDIDPADDPLSEMAEVGGEMEEQVSAGGEQEHAAQRAFDRDQAKDESCARRVAGPDRQSLSTSARRSYVLGERCDGLP